MATKYNGLFDYAANYNVQLAQPLDTRGVCDSVAALLAKDTFGTGGSFAYDGLTVVVPNAGVYYLKDKSKLTAKVNAAGYTDPTSATDEELLAAGWQKLGDQAASNVNSINGKTGNVTLAAGDIGITAIDGVEGENIQTALEAINTKASTAYKYKGSKATYEELPAEGNQVGDVWNVVAAHGTTPAGTNYAWTGTEWDALGGLVDLSTYQTKAITIDGAATTVEAAIAANKTSAADNATAIGKNKTDIETISGSVKGLDTLVKSKQDATVDVSVNGAAYTTIPEAIGALDTYVGEVKAVSDGAAKVDASNIADTGAWKTKLGYALESSLNTVATNVETVSGDLKALSTKVDTISGDLDTLEVSVATKASSTDLQAVSAQVNVNTAAIATKATQADMTALSGKVETNISAISTINTALTGKVAKSDIATTISAADAASDEKVASEKAVATAISTINTSIDGKADKADTYTKTEVNTELGKKQDKLTTYTETTENKLTTAKITANTINLDGITNTVINAGTKVVIEGLDGGVKINGGISGDVISTSIPASTSASDTKVPSEKAVASAVEAVKSVASKAYKYKGSDTYANISAIQDAEVGDVWNSTTANGVYPKGTNYAWNGTEWDALGGEVDLSAYQTKAITVGEEETTVEAAINAVKTTADAAAKADASNITVATWKTKLGFITADDQVQPDWKATSGKAQILNKPYIDTVAGVPGIPGIDLTTTTVSGDKIILKTAEVNNGEDSIEATTHGRINITSSGYSSFGSLVTIKADSPGTGGTINLIAPEGIKGGYDQYRGTIKLSTGTGEIKLEGETATVNSLAINKATLITGDNTIALATAGKIICKSGANVTEFVVNGESVVKEILSGSDIFSISAYADGSYTLASTAAGNAIIMNI